MLSSSRLLSSSRAPLAAVVLVAAAALAGCASVSVSTPQPTKPVVSTPPATASGTPAATSVPTSAPTTAPTVAPTVTPAPTQAPSAQATTGATPAASSQPITTPVPGSSLDVTMSDAGVVGRLTIPDDTRIYTDGHTGTHEIIGLESDGSSCSFSFEGDTFTAVAWFDEAPDGMLHQMSVSVPSDEMPANDGEQRSGIQDGRVYADFSSESGIGTAYSGDATDGDNGGSSTIDIVQEGPSLTLTFTGTTWDPVDFSGQMICAKALE